MTAAIILSAGESRRMGVPKAFLPFRDGTFLSVLARTLSTACGHVIAVFGFEGDRLSQSAPVDVHAVVNRDYQLGMLTSLQAGLYALPADFDHVMFTLVDHPAVSPETLSALTRETAPIAIPRYNGRRGHPVLLSRAIADEFLAEPVTSKVHDVINRHASSIRYIDVPDRAVTDDIDNGELYRDLLARETAFTQ